MGNHYEPRRNTLVVDVLHAVECVAMCVGTRRVLDAARVVAR